MATKSELYRKAASAAANYVKVASQRKLGKATAKQVVAAKKKYAAATKRLKASEAAEKKEAKKKAAKKKASKKKASKKKVARRTTKIGDFKVIVESIWAEDIETGRRRVPRGHTFDWSVAEAKRGGRVKETGTARTKAEAEKKARVERRRLQAELDQKATKKKATKKKATKKKATKKKATKKKATKKKATKKKVAKSSLTRSQIRTRNANTQKSVNADIRKLVRC